MLLPAGLVCLGVRGLQCIVDSQQVSLKPEEMILYDNGEVLENDTTIDKLIKKNGICTYAVLTIRQEGVSPLLGGTVSRLRFVVDKVDI